MIDKEEILGTKTVDPDKIVCRTCLYKNEGQTKYPHYTKSFCGIYTANSGRDKPNDVYFDNADCPFYEKE